MFDITLSDDLTVNIDGTSEGTQTKFYDKGYGIKQILLKKALLNTLFPSFSHSALCRRKAMLFMNTER